MNPSWQRKKISEIAQHSLGKMLDKEKNRGNLQRYLRNINVRWFNFDLSDVLEMRFLAEESTKYTAIKGDVLVCEGGYPGRAAIWNNDEPIFFQKALHRVRFHELARNKWFVYYLHFRDLDGTLKEHFNGAGIQHFTGEALAKFELPLPPLSEQQRIVAILDEAFDGIATARANAEQNIRNARALFESHLQAVFIQRGEGWLEKALLELCDVKHGFAFNGEDFSSDVPAGMPLVITPGNFTEDGRLLFGEKNTKRYNGKPPFGFLFNVGDLVVVMTDLSSKMKILGKPAFVETSDVLHNQRIGRVIFLDSTLEKRFLYYFMMSEMFLKNIKGSATGTMVKHTAPKRILSNVIAFPKDLAEQRTIVEKLDYLREETQRLESICQRKLAALDELKKSLLHQAFSGRL